MMEFNLNTNSWHFFVANFAGVRVASHKENNICSYTRSFLIGLFWLTLATIATVFIVVGTGFMIYDIFDYYMRGNAFTVLGELIGMIYILSIVVIVSLAFVALLVEVAIPQSKKLTRKLLNKCHDEERLGFLALAYRKFKDKTCFKIKFNE